MPPTARYRPHGSTRIQVEGQMLLTDLVGPFNLDCYELWARQALVALTGMARQGPTVSLVRFAESALTQPELLPRMQQATRTAVASCRLVAIAFVIPPAIEAAFLARRVYEPWHEGVVDFQVFDTEAPARAWLNGRLAAA
jgi:hypothetical protein